MNYRLTTLSDLMIFKTTGNCWNQELTKQFPTLLPLPECPVGDRLLRIGQYWASSKYAGQNGNIFEIMGIQGKQINGRSWTLAIPSLGWADTGAIRRRLTWVTPRNLSDSRGAGATEYIDIDFFFSGELRLYTLSEEVPRYRVENGENINCVARAIRSCHDEEKPIMPQHKLVDLAIEDNTELATTWDQWRGELFHDEVEVYTDGSMRYITTQPIPEC